MPFSDLCWRLHQPLTVKLYRVSVITLLLIVILSLRCTRHLELTEKLVPDVTKHRDLLVIVRKQGVIYHDLRRG